MRITGQGAVYVRTLQQLSHDEDSEEEISEDFVTLPSSSEETSGSVQRDMEGGYLYFGYF